MLLVGIVGCVVPIVINLVGLLAGRAVAAHLLRIPVRWHSAAPVEGYQEVPSGRRFLWHWGGLLGAYLGCVVLSFAVTLAAGVEQNTRAVVPVQGSVASTAGMRAGDVVVAIDGKTIETWEELRAAVPLVGDRETTIVVLREGHELALPIRPVGGRIGVQPILRRTPIAGRSAMATALAGPPLVLFETAQAVLRRQSQVGGMIDVVRATSKSAGQGALSLAILLMLLTNYSWLPVSVITEAALTPRSATRLVGGLIAARRDTRLFAHWVDMLLYALAAALGMLAGDLAGRPTVALVGGAFGLALCLVAQATLVATTGQSLGKRWLRLRIVRLDGSKVGFVRGVLLRSWLFGVAMAIPYVRAPVAILGPLLVFSNRSRCLHDYVVGTVVVRPELCERDESIASVSPPRPKTSPPTSASI